MHVTEPLAIESISTGTFHLYRAAILVCGLLLAALGGWGLGAPRHARVLSVAVGGGLVAYSAYLWVFFNEQTTYEVYPWLFIGPVLVASYQFYARATDREADEAARAEFEKERAARRAARAAEQNDQNS